MAEQNNQTTMDALMNAILNLTNKFDGQQKLIENQQTLIKQQQKTIEQLTSIITRTRDDVSKLVSYNEEKETVTIKVVLSKLSNYTSDINNRLKSKCALVQSFSVQDRILVLIAKISKDGTYSHLNANIIDRSYNIAPNNISVVNGKEYEIKYSDGDGYEYIRLDFEPKYSNNYWSSSQ